MMRMFLALATIEYEPGCLSDLKRAFDELVDLKREYDHNAAWGMAMGTAICGRPY